MNCPDAQALLQLQLDGSEVLDRAALERHLTTCPDCRGLFAAAQLLEEGLRLLPRPLPSPGFQARVAAAVVVDRAARMRWRRRLLYAGAVAAVLCVTTFAAVFWQRASQNDLASGTPEVKVVEPDRKPVPPAPPATEGPSVTEALREARVELGAAAKQAGAASWPRSGLFQVARRPQEIPMPVSFVGLSPLDQPVSLAHARMRKPVRGSTLGTRLLSNLMRRSLDYFQNRLPPLQPRTQPER
jgi:hypothetical protein